MLRSAPSYFDPFELCIKTSIQLLKHADIKAPIPLVLHTNYDRRLKKAISSAKHTLDLFENEVLEYTSSHPLSFFRDRRLEYLGVRNQVKSGKYAEFMDGIRANHRAVFGNASPNPYSTRVFSSDGHKLVVAYQYAAPEEVIKPNQQAVAAGKSQDVCEQPGRHSLLVKNHLIPVSSAS